MANEEKGEFPDDTLHLAGSEGVSNRSVMTGCGPEEPKGCRVSVWKLEKWLKMSELMICFLKYPECTQPVPDGLNLKSLGSRRRL